MLNGDAREVYEAWLAVSVGSERAELLGISHDPEQIEDRFAGRLSFGTGGLRGLMGVGLNRMNIRTVRAATRGLAAYLLKNPAKTSGPAGLGRIPTVAVAFDSRHHSEEFARETARVFSCCGINAFIYPRLTPTPALSFAVRTLGCDAGVVITASHNPAPYNGYKVYASDGGQITGAAEAIQREIEAIDPLEDLPEPRCTGFVRLIPDTVGQAYCCAILDQRLSQETAGDLRIVYTPLHGTGLEYVTAVLKAAGYENVTVVKSQQTPDGAFPGCQTPNPEDDKALAEGLRLCEELNADLLLATDPDCDRVGVAVRGKDAYRRLSGNEAGALLLEYICRARREYGTMPMNPVIVKTIVTTELAAPIAAEYGAELRDVLTGFKYIGEQIGDLEREGRSGSFLFGFEESCGYLTGTFVRDKDGVNACMLICDMASWHRRHGRTLAEALDELYRRYGYYASGLESFTFPGEAGLQAMRQVMGRLRADPPEEIAGWARTEARDYLSSGPQAPAEGGKPIHSAFVKRSDVLQYRFADGTLVTVRPSGTEPKLKLYFSVVRDDMPQAQAALEAFRQAFSRLIH